MTPAAPIILPSGEILDPRTAASAESGMDRITAAKESDALGDLLDRLSPPIAKEFRSILRTSAAKSFAAPSQWSPSTAFNMARAAFDAEFALRAAGVDAWSLADFGSDASVDAICAHYTTATGSQRNVGRILQGVRTLVRLRTKGSSRYIGRKIREAARTPRRGENEILPTAEMCLEGAMAEFAAAVAMMRHGRPRRGKTRMRDAVILAIEIVLNFRRGEFAAINLDIVIFDDVRAQVKIVIPETASKVREVQLGVITDEKIIAMLRTLVADRSIGHLFETNWGAPLASASAYKALRRIGLRTTGVALNFNKARRIGVSEETNIGAMQARVRHARYSKVTEQNYSWHPDDLELNICREALAVWGQPPHAGSGSPARKRPLSSPAAEKRSYGLGDGGRSRKQSTPRRL